jgi:subtilisin family serine protease
LGEGSFDHNYNWYDLVNGLAQPYDDNGHSTVTVGLMVGDDGGANQIGVAPGAEWIAVKALDIGGSGSLADLHAALDWMLAPTDLGGSNPDPDKRPQVGLNAWGIASDCDTEFQPDLQAWQAAGILPVFALGTWGPGCAALRSPSDLPEALTAGATDADDEIWGFSGFGPSCWGDIKPEVAAPGVDIRSSYKNGEYVVSSGTTRSAPHLAGTAAPVLSADPALDPVQVETIITSTALCIQDLMCGGTACPDGANNIFGWGRIDAFEAVSLTVGGPDLPFDIPWLSETPVSGTLAPGGGVSVAVTFDTAGLDAGTYLGLLDVESNDPVTPSLSIPVTLTVQFCDPVTGTIMTWEPLTPTVEQVVVFTAEATGTAPITYRWDLGDGSWASGPLVLHSYPEAGTYTVALTATNTCGEAV